MAKNVNTQQEANSNTTLVSINRTFKFINFFCSNYSNTTLVSINHGLTEYPQFPGQNSNTTLVSINQVNGK